MSFKKNSKIEFLRKLVCGCEVADVYVKFQRMKNSFSCHDSRSEVGKLKIAIACAKSHCLMDDITVIIIQSYPTFK